MPASPLVARSRVLSRSISLASKPSISSCRSESRRISLISRLPMDSSCLITMLPLHSAIAAARLRSVLSAECQSWGWIPQGMYRRAQKFAFGDRVLIMVTSEKFP